MYKIEKLLLTATVLLGVVVIGRTQGETSPAAPLKRERRQPWREVLADYDYVAIASAYADYMIEHGRDRYGKEHTPLFVTGMDRHTGKLIFPPFPHVKRKPFMPGWERDRECRPSDRNYGNADPLDQLTLLKLMHRLTEITGDVHYAEEADKTAAWWMANTQTPIGLYPWGSHTYWSVTNESGGGTFEFNHVWPKDTKDYTVSLPPGARVLVACAAPDKWFIRRLDLKSDASRAVRLEQFVFVMTPRSKLN